MNRQEFESKYGIKRGDLIFVLDEFTIYRIGIYSPSLVPENTRDERFDLLHSGTNDDPEETDFRSDCESSVKYEEISRARKILSKSEVEKLVAGVEALPEHRLPRWRRR